MTQKPLRRPDPSTPSSTNSRHSSPSGPAPAAPASEQSTTRTRLGKLSEALAVTDPAHAAEVAHTAGHLRRAGAREYLAFALASLVQAQLLLGDWGAADKQLAQSRRLRRAGRPRTPRLLPGLAGGAAGRCHHRRDNAGGTAGDAGQRGSQDKSPTSRSKSTRVPWIRGSAWTPYPGISLTRVSLRSLIERRRLKYDTGPFRCFFLGATVD
jgi:hypothetical protein